MRRFVLLFSLVTASVSAAPAPIVGGTAATQGEFPNVVGIVLTTSSGFALCTGTLITDEWVMTAAHCVYPAEAGFSSQAEVTNAIRVYVNALTIFPAPPGNDGLTAQDSMYDPNFQGTDSSEIAQGHDLGLIHLSEPVTGVAAARLNFDASSAPPGISVVEVGYGATMTGNPPSGAGTLYTVGQTATMCSTLVGVNDSMFLCFNQNNGTGKCEGDSGGPSFAQIDGQTVEVGVTSFGDPTCSTYGADTRVDFEKSFLTSVIPSLGTCMTDSDCGSGHECFESQCIVDPYGMGGLGSACGSAADCANGDCVTTTDGQRCSMACTSGNDSTCPGGFTCLADGSNGTCWPGSGGGCCDASGHGAPTAVIGIALVGIVLRRRRITRR